MPVLCTNKRVRFYGPVSHFQYDATGSDALRQPWTDPGCLAYRTSNTRSMATRTPRSGRHGWRSSCNTPPGGAVQTGGDPSLYLIMTARDLSKLLARKQLNSSSPDGSRHARPRRRSMRT